MLRRKNSSAFILGASILVVSALYLTLPTDPISRVIQNVLFGIDNRLEQESSINNPNLELENRIAELKAENDRLRRELSYKLNDKFTTVTASIAAKSVQNYRSTIDINAGGKDGIEVGQAVMSQGQLIGRVSEIFDNRSRVLTISDPDFRAAAVIESTTRHGLVRHVAGGVILDQVPREEKSKAEGKRVLTSGLGGVFPPGLLIGRVSDEISNSGAIFQKFVITGVIDIGLIEEVVVLK